MLTCMYICFPLGFALLRDTRKQDDGKVMIIVIIAFVKGMQCLLREQWKIDKFSVHVKVDR